MPTSSTKHALGLSCTATLLLLVLLVAGVEWAAEKVYWETLERDESQRELKQAKYAVFHDTASYDVIVLGDSTAGNNFSPEVFRRVTGLSSFILHTNSNISATANVYLLDEYLKRHPAPKMVIVVESPYAWLLPQHHDILLEHFTRPDLAWDLWTHGLFTNEELAESTMSWWAPSLRHRRHIQRLRQDADLLQGMFDGNSEQFKDTRYGHIRVNRSIVDSDAYQGEMHAVIDMLQKRIGDPSRGLTTEAVLMKKKLCKTASAANIPAVVMLAPLPEPVIQDRDAYLGLNQMEQSIRDIVSPAGCRVLDSTSYAAALFADGVHLNEDGAGMFSQELGVYLLQLLQKDVHSSENAPSGTMGTP